jgi:hypothetical protein
MSRIRRLAVMAVFMSVLPLVGCSLTDSSEKRVARAVNFDSAECQPADSNISCDVFDNGAKVLTGCTMYAGPGSSSAEPVFGCRRLPDVQVEGQTWDDVDERFRRAGLQPEIGFPGEDTSEEYAVTLGELDRSNRDPYVARDLYVAFVFRSNRAAAKYVGRPTRLARLLFGSASPPDLKETLEGTMLRRGTLLVWYRKGVPSLQSGFAEWSQAPDRARRGLGIGGAAAGAALQASKPQGTFPNTGADDTCAADHGPMSGEREPRETPEPLEVVAFGPIVHQRQGSIKVTEASSQPAPMRLI